LVGMVALGGGGGGGGGGGLSGQISGSGSAGGDYVPPHLKLQRPADIPDAWDDD